MSIRNRGDLVRPRFDRDAGDTQRALSVHAKLLMCLLPEFDQVSISVLDASGRAGVWASVGDLVNDLDRLQQDVDEGPGIDAFASARPVVAPDIQHDDRWPAYVTAAAELGLRSQVATPLRWRDHKLRGVLDMYSTTHARIGFSAPLVAEVVAAQVASALASFSEIQALDRALADRTVLAQASGMVMAWHHCDADHAFAYLRSVAARQGQTLVRVAEDLVRTRELPSARPA